MHQSNQTGGGVVLSRSAILLAASCLVAMLIATGEAAAQTTPRPQGEDAIIARWRPELERYVKKLEGKGYRGDFVIEGYLGQLDWGGDDYEEVSPGRFYAFSVRFRDVNSLEVEVITTRAVLIDDAGKIVGDIEYPNSRLVWPDTQQPYLFGIPALRPTIWRNGNGRLQDVGPAANCRRAW